MRCVAERGGFFSSNSWWCLDDYLLPLERMQRRSHWKHWPQIVPLSSPWPKRNKRRDHVRCHETLNAYELHRIWDLALNKWYTPRRRQCRFSAGTRRSTRVWFGGEQEPSRGGSVVLSRGVPGVGRVPLPPRPDESSRKRLHAGSQRRRDSFPEGVCASRPLSLRSPERAACSVAIDR